MNRVRPFQPSEEEFTTLIRQGFCASSRGGLGAGRAIGPSSSLAPLAVRVPFVVAHRLLTRRNPANLS
jgi:hypothetical protein